MLMQALIQVAMVRAQSVVQGASGDKRQVAHLEWHTQCAVQRAAMHVASQVGAGCGKG